VSGAPSDAAIVARLRARGVRIGADCRIYSTDFSTEPYLVTLSDGVGIAGGVKFITHDGAARLRKAGRPNIQLLAPIVVGANTFIGENAIILPGTSIGQDCIIGAGAVVRGKIPDNSLVAGNPARVVGRASLFLDRLEQSPNALDTFAMPEPQRRAAIVAHFELEDLPHE
jgi:acetyltransferase-like isoleucine patch superfamily enzyme